MLDQPLVAEYRPATDDEFRRDVTHVYTVYSVAMHVCIKIAKQLPNSLIDLASLLCISTTHAIIDVSPQDRIGP
jgi:hypothetical protein